jgi:F-type H+-transporting ATPase subunit b
MPIATSNFLIPNGTFIVELIAFVLVLGIAARYILPPLNNALRVRQERIRSELEAADVAKAEAEAADEARRAELEHARQQAREIVAQANRTAEALVAEAETRAQEEKDRILATAAAEVRLARQRALEEAATRLGDLVMEVVGRVIGREVDAEAHRDLIEEAVAALNEPAGSVGAGGRPGVGG